LAEVHFSPYQVFAWRLTFTKTTQLRLTPMMIHSFSGKWG
jgi:hypothetical protein